VNKKISLIFFLGVLGCSVKPLPFDMGNPKWGVDITWHGQSCFTFKDSIGRTVVIDPCDETVGYGWLNLRADALLITHDHFDHNYKRAVKARRDNIELVENTGTVSVASNLFVTGLASFHDDQGGAINGPNIIYTFTMGGLRCVHLGDLGQKSLTEAQRTMIGPVDVLFVPVGGFTTLDAQGAKAVVDTLKPSVIFPMHYGNIRFYPLDPVEKFTSLFSPDQVKIIKDSHIRIKLPELPEKPWVIVLTPTQKNY
jgi:L-ascorbate metabolism protein UlaG (beta-lactamase superfamily)